MTCCTHAHPLRATCLVSNACCRVRCCGGAQLAMLFGLAHSRGLKTEALSFSWCLPMKAHLVGLAGVSPPETCLMSHQAQKTDLLPRSLSMRPFGSQLCLPEAAPILLPELRPLPVEVSLRRPCPPKEHSATTLLRWCAYCRYLLTRPLGQQAFLPLVMHH